MTNVNESLAKIGERQVIQSQIKEKFNQLKRLADQKNKIEAEAAEVFKEIQALSTQSEAIADWLLEKEYAALTEIQH